MHLETKGRRRWDELATFTMTKIELCRRERKARRTWRTGVAAARLWFPHYHSDFRGDGGSESERGKRERGTERFARKREVTAVAGDHLSWPTIAATERTDSPFGMRMGLWSSLLPRPSLLWSLYLFPSLSLSLFFSLDVDHQWFHRPQWLVRRVRAYCHGHGRVSLPTAIAVRNYDGSASHGPTSSLRGCDSARWNIAACQRPYMNRFSRALRSAYPTCLLRPVASTVTSTRPTASRHSSCLGLTAVSSTTRWESNGVFTANARVPTIRVTARRVGKLAPLQLLGLIGRSTIDHIRKL